MRADMKPRRRRVGPNVTKRAALLTLVEFAARWGAGSGVGIRPVLRNEDRERIAWAVVRLWPDCHTYPVTNSALRNLGLPGVLALPERPA